jgi:anti-anti-sigma factor
MDFAEIRRLYAVKRSDFWICIAAIAGVVFGGVLAGVIIGAVLSLGWLVRVVTAPTMPLLARAPGTHVFREVSEAAGDEQIPGVIALRLDGDLFFVTADPLEDRIRELILEAPAPPEVVVLDCQSMDYIDSQGASKVGEIAVYLKKEGVSFKLARVKPGVMDVLTHDGQTERIGLSNFHLDVDQAVRMHLERSNEARNVRTSESASP